MKMKKKNVLALATSEICFEKLQKNYNCKINLSLDDKVNPTVL